MVYDYEGKADLDKGYWNPKRKLGVITHFLEIILKVSIWKKKVVHCSILKRFSIIVAQLSLKMRSDPFFKIRICS